jgi:uncharacterized membrane protein YsdA (DUF1294 family)
MNPAWTLALLWVFISGFIGFILMGVDKSRARDREWRIPEKTFFALGLAGGAFGIVVGSSVFHHKTLKASFLGVILFLAVVWVGILVEFERLLGPPFG